MDGPLFERLVLSFESIAESLKGLYEESRKAGNRYWPTAREQRDAVVTRVESEEERTLKMQGARRRTISEIVDPNAEEQEEDDYEIFGERSRQWLKDHSQEEQTEKPDAGAEDAVPEKARRRRTKAPKDR